MQELLLEFGLFGLEARLRSVVDWVLGQHHLRIKKCVEFGLECALGQVLLELKFLLGEKAMRGARLPTVLPTHLSPVKLLKLLLFCGLRLSRLWKKFDNSWRRWAGAVGCFCGRLLLSCGHIVDGLGQFWGQDDFALVQALSFGLILWLFFTPRTTRGRRLTR